MVKYISSEKENEAKRLSLIGEDANPYTVFMLHELKRSFPGIYRILDVGCGTGEAFPILKEVFSESTIIGIDQSLDSLEIAGKKNIAEKLIACDLNYLSQDEELKSYMPFDLIFIRNTMIHIKNPQSLMEEMKKCGKKGSFIFVQESDWAKARADWSEFDIFKEILIEMMSDYKMHPYIGSELRELFKVSKIKIINEQSFQTKIGVRRNTWNILFYLLDVARERLEPYLKKYEITSIQDMRERLEIAKKVSQNEFYAPSWNIVFGKI